ncbi:hypothetical protein D9758_002276 [Tetrapyrgos nigripes]|uniref:Uncharacterized protein n=1 Tax=Tetrapyrgos nigripes TaxID=182062 RepID=A0A8H5LT51_9AGAR|nr:hypothetical protein D9758_002276 [Tetrapyrgos nigripes]
MAAPQQGKIFNVEEPTGAEQVKFETTAATAQLEAPNATAARAVEKNTEIAHDAAETAAAAARSFGKEFTGEPPSATDKLQSQAKDITNTAASEGKQDVDAATAAGAGYLNQAKAMATNAVQTAQEYINAGAGGATNGTSKSTPSSATGGSAAGIVPQVTAGAAVAFETAKGYAATAQQTVQPHLERTFGAAKQYVDNLTEQGNPNSGTPGTTKPAVPATTAPLESGPHTVGGPYSSTTGSNVGANSS